MAAPTAPTTIPDQSTWRHASATITSPSGSINIAGSSQYSFRLHYVDVAAYAGTAKSAESKAKGTFC